MWATIAIQRRVVRALDLVNTTHLTNIQQTAPWQLKRVTTWRRTCLHEQRKTLWKLTCMRLITSAHTRIGLDLDQPPTRTCIDLHQQTDLSSQLLESRRECWHRETMARILLSMTSTSARMHKHWRSSLGPSSRSPQERSMSSSVSITQ